MLNKKVVIDNQKIIVNFDEHLSNLVDWLLEYMTRTFSNSNELKDGFKIVLAWSALTLRCNDSGDLVLCEPDFSKNPFQDEVDNVNCSLLMQSLQLGLTRDLNESPLFTSFQDSIIIRKGCFEFSELYMIRNEPNKEKQDSGWYISTRELEHSKEYPTSSDYESVYAFELIKYKPALLEALGLPIGFFVTSNNNQIETISNADNEEVFSV